MNIGRMLLGSVIGIEPPSLMFNYFVIFVNTQFNLLILQAIILEKNDSLCALGDDSEAEQKDVDVSVFSSFGCGRYLSIGYWYV